jgi:glucosamine-6-phosphate deaminase
MKIAIHADRPALGSAAAAEAAEAVRRALASAGRCTLVIATGTSQLEVLAALAAAEGIAWERVEIFHLDEYCGLAADHPASFRRYLRERFYDLLPVRPAAFHWIGADGDPRHECRRLAEVVPEGPFDLVLCGIGENAHLAFNDPPADFVANEPYLAVALDEACRRQQVGEGWFATLADVPTHAISMSIRRIMAATTIICSVPDSRKAAAVRDSVEGPVTATVPASILQTHADCRLHVDRAAAALLREAVASG